MAKNNAIVEIQGTDLISESMHKINDNFKILAETEEQDRYKWQTYVDSVNSKIEELKALTNSKNSVIEENIHTLADEIKNIPTIDNLQKQVTEAIENASDVVANVIATNAGDYISSALTGYVKTTSMNDELRKYVLSTGFEEYKSNADIKYASANRIVANSSFMSKNGYLVYKNGEQSEYNSIEKYYTTVKQEIDPDNKGIDDVNVYNRLIAKCEQTFKTITNELTAIQQEVGEGTSSVSIIAAVKGALGAGDSGDDAEDIAASIFAQANEEGSLIRLRANQIDLSSDSLNVTTGQFTVNANDNNANFQLKANGDVKVKGNITASSGKIGDVDINNGGLRSKNKGTSANPSYNFTLDSDGKLTVKEATITGSITATALTISSGSSAETTLKSFIEGVGTEKHWGDTTDSYSDGWLTNAFSKTSISGGLALTGNLFVADSQSNVTAGIMGGNAANVNDIRFFAGSDVEGSSNAPFRVYEDGSMTAGQMSVDVTTGNITFQNDKTWIDSTGKLHATGANISGLISTPLFRITEENFLDYVMDDEWDNTIYVLDISKTGTSVQIEYMNSSRTPGVVAVYDIYLPVITEDMVGSELTILNFTKTPRSLSIGGSPYSSYSPLTPSNRALIRSNDDKNGITGYNLNLDYLQFAKFKAIEVPSGSWAGSYAWVALIANEYISNN